VRHLVIDHRFVTTASVHLPTFSAWQVRSVSFVIACISSASTDPDVAWLLGTFESSNMLLRVQETA
jgi:hypothetical protein